MRFAEPRRDRNFQDTRIRFRFSRNEAASGIAHSAQIKEFRRRALASGLPCCGNTVPKMSFGPALSEGCSSLCEFADLYLYEFVMADEAAEKMRQLDDEKFTLLSANRIPVFFPTVESATNTVRYAIYSDDAVFLQDKLSKFLSMEECPYERHKPNGKVQLFDVRKIFQTGDILDGGRTLVLTLAYEEGANLRPDAAAKSIFGQEISIGKVVRQELLWRDSKGNYNVF